MGTQDLPSRPDAAQYRKQAKDLVKAHAAGQPAALDRIRRHHPRLGPLADVALRAAPFQLADAQLVLAREHGCASWPKFLERLATRAGSPAALPWRAADEAVARCDEEALARLLAEHPALRSPRPARDGSAAHADLADGDATAILLRWHRFESAADLRGFRAALAQPGSPVARFEAAADAVVSGDEAALARLLRGDPSLVHARSPRRHRSTLLHYVAANGVEAPRERTPRNAAAIARQLLDAGAAIDAVAPVYGADTPLGLIVTSIHPLRAGALEDLLELLLARGAAIDGAPGAGSAVDACLANGRRAAAELLAARGARLDLEGAAGVGRLDLVRGFVAADGALRDGATREQLLRGFAWACEYGRADVVAFLLDHGVPVEARLPNHANTGLHWAALNGHLGIAELLLARGAPLEATDATYGSTPLGWAIHGWRDPGPDAWREGAYAMVARLVRAGAIVEPRLREDAAVRADARLMAALATPRG